jgi:hypothetical protein
MRLCKTSILHQIFCHKLTVASWSSRFVFLQYRNNYPPVSSDGRKLNVEVGLNVLNIGGIEDIKMKFLTKFQASAFFKKPLWAKVAQI